MFIYTLLWTPHIRIYLIPPSTASSLPHYAEINVAIQRVARGLLSVHGYKRRGEPYHTQIYFLNRVRHTSSHAVDICSVNWYESSGSASSFAYTLLLLLLLLLYMMASMAQNEFIIAYNNRANVAHSRHKCAWNYLCSAAMYTHDPLLYTHIIYMFIYFDVWMWLLEYLNIFRKFWTFLLESSLWFITKWHVKLNNI